MFVLAVLFPALASSVIAQEHAGRKSQVPVKIAGSDLSFVDSAECSACHGEISRQFARTGMARSFYPLTPATDASEFERGLPYYHAASNRYYNVRRQNGRYFLVRYQHGSDGGEINLLEREIHFVLGSGNHARGYVHRTADGRLLQLPLTWYSERGGFWAMAPGYDRPDHPDFRREIDYECFACHNAYPEIQPGADRYGLTPQFLGKIPDGIDCQRCHGAGGSHVEAARSGRAAAQIRASILNPARLSVSAQLEVCMQCHLETTSEALPHSVLRHDAGWFSYRPGRPLKDHVLHFDHAPGSPFQEKFEVVNAVYRLRKSSCFAGSPERMTCTICHDPHSPATGEEAQQRYDQACRGCHSTGSKSIPPGHANAACARCHMSKRETDDAPHVFMTDHLIQRIPASAKAKPQSQPYRGPVTPYYPATLIGEKEGELYLGVAQVRGQANLEAGIKQLERAFRSSSPKTGLFHFELAEGYRHAGRPADAAGAYRQALRNSGAFPEMWAGLGASLAAVGDLAGAIRSLEQGRERWPRSAVLLNALGDLYRRAGRTADARQTLLQAREVNPDLPEIHSNLCVVLLAQDDPEEARRSCIAAIRLQPDLAPAHNNLAAVLLGANRLAEAAVHAEQAVRLAPRDLSARLTYATILASQEKLDEAGREWEAALDLDPTQAGAYLNLGILKRRRQDLPGAIRFYRRAIALKPDLWQAHFNLALTLLEMGDRNAARTHFNKAAQSPDDGLRTAAQQALQRLDRATP